MQHREHIMAADQANRANLLRSEAVQEEPAMPAADGDGSYEAAQDAFTSEGGRAPPQVEQAFPSGTTDVSPSNDHVSRP